MPSEPILEGDNLAVTPGRLGLPWWGYGPIRCQKRNEPVHALHILGGKVTAPTVTETVTLMPPGSAIVNLASITFHQGRAPMTCYVATKGGMIGFSRSLARELGPHNVHINCITPGAIKTEGEVIHADPAQTAEIQSRQCLDRRLLPEDVARVALFLASAMSDGMTGQTVNVDGGLILY